MLRIDMVLGLIFFVFEIKIRDDEIKAAKKERNKQVKHSHHKDQFQSEYLD